MSFSKWELPKLDSKNSALIRREYGVSALISDILAGRGLTAFELSEILLTDTEPESPFALPDMRKAVQRIHRGVDSGERIAIYGDYDCDGVTSMVMLYSYLQTLGANVFTYIPERLDEGYGMNMGALDEIQKKGATLIITVDNGISAHKEVEYANTLGVEVIITDHHQLSETLPNAYAVVNPHRADYQNGFRSLCGAGVVLKLIAAMEDGDYESAMEGFGALAAIGTVGDIVPLVSENRYLVRRGLSLIPETDNPGLQALLEVAGLSDKPLDAGKLAFGLVPRINAAGRMGSANLAVQLLLSEDYDLALELANQINDLNTRRREEEAAILQTILQNLSENPQLLQERVLVLAAENLNQGVVGIVCSRLLELFGKPNLILSCEDGIAVGSGRSVGNFSLHKALMSCSQYLEKYGGHSLAAGLTLKTENLPAFIQALSQYAATYHDQMPVPVQRIDKVLTGGDISLEAVASLSQLEPFGEGNPSPVFLMKNCRVEELIPLAQNKHLKMKVLFEGKPVHVLYFRMSTEDFPYPVGTMVDILVNLELNSFRDSRSIAVKLKDIRPTGLPDDKLINAHHFYQKISRGEPVEAKVTAIALPTLDELRGLYKFIRQQNGVQQHIDVFYLSAVFQRMNYCKYRFSLDIMAEMKLLEIPPDHSRILVLPVTGKVDLEQSQILAKLTGKGD